MDDFNRTESGERIYRLPAVGFATLVSNLADLNKRAAKLKVEPVSYEILSSETVISKVEGREYAERFYNVTVSGGYPHLNGWRLVGVIEPTDAGNIVKAVPGETVPVEYRDASNYCEHCKSARYRKATYIIAHEDGATAQVGGNCLAAYVGSNRTPANLASIAEFLFELDSYREESDFRSGRGLTQVDTAKFLTTVVALSRQYGFKTKKQIEIDGFGTATGELAWNLENDARAVEEMRRDGMQDPTEQDARAAIAAIAFAQALDGKSEFDHNLKVSASLAAIDYRQIGIAAYIVEAHRRQVEKDRKSAAEAVAPKIETAFVGEVGKRQVFENIAVDRIFEFDSDFGVMRIIKMRDVSGNALVWKTGTACGWAYDAQESGELVSFKASVKAHENYRDEKQTLVTRVAGI